MADDVDRPERVMPAATGTASAQLARARAVAAQKAAEAAEATALAAEAEAEAEAVTADESAGVGAQEKVAHDAGERAEKSVAEEMSSEHEGNTVSRSPMGRRQFAFASGFLAVVAVALALASVYMLLHHRTVSTQEERETAIVDFTTANISNLIAPSYEDADGSAQRILDAATGDWAEQFGPNKDAFAAALVEAKVQSSADVTDVGIEKLNEDGTTDLLVSATSQVQNTVSPDPTLRTWRLRVTVTEMDGQYKFSKVEQIV
jgi:Mce-associated membrane protein